MIKFFNKNQYWIITLIIICAAVLLSNDLFARLGGGGGSSNSGGSGDDIGALIVYIFMLIPFPLNIIVIALLIGGYYYLNKKRKQKSVLNKMPGGHNMASNKNPEGYERFKSLNPDFDEGKFKEKVKTAFIELQKAWASKDMSKVRHYISDGMYQRLNTQFKMMDLLSQINKLEKIEVKNVVIDRIDSDGQFDIIHVAVHAFMNDRFISEKYPSLNSGGPESFVEYWSFMKKRGAQEKDIFSTNNCPNCGGELPKKAGEVAKCEFCGTYINSGEYDWVLAEITQADDYISANPEVVKAGNLKEQVMKLVGENEDFAVQLIEDKTSNAYLQIQTARVYKDPKLIRRFVTDSAFEKIKNIIETEQSFIYNRLYLNDVSLIGIMQENNKNVLMVSIKSSYQRVAINEKNNKKVSLIDSVVMSKTEVILLERDINASKQKGSLYAHSCPSCGGPTGDTLNLKCQYCGAELNSSSQEWIVRDLMSLHEYYAFYSANGANFVSGIAPDNLDGLYKVRDYAFNNVLIMAASDGVFSDEEKEFTQKIAKKWGYNLDKIQPIFDMAAAGKLSIKMPEDRKMKEKIYKMMEKAASIDGNVAPEEQQLLDQVKTMYLN
ncbi:MAG: hypothetical protein Kow0068_02530 [Marinilabiliales bacterium]